MPLKVGDLTMQDSAEREAYRHIEFCMQAIWNFSMTAPANQTVLFNTPRQDTMTMENGWATTIFEPTPPMSSYLVAFIVGNLTGVSQNVPTLDGVGKERPVSIYGIPERLLPLLLHHILQAVVKEG